MPSGLWAVLLVFVMVSTALLPVASIASAAPTVGDRFGYQYNTHVDHGSGTYEGYTDKMISSSHYVVTAVQGDTVTMRAQGSWTFSGSDGARDSGTLDRTFNFSQSSRRYIGPSDLEENYTDPSVWFWIPPNLNQGDTVRILEDMFTVTSADKTVWMGMVPHKVIELTTSSVYTRSDSYGVFSASYSDTYCFDRATGYLVSEKYVEEDSNGEAGFRYTADIHVTSSSYSVPIDWMTLLVYYLVIPLIVVALVLLVWKLRRGPSGVKVNTANGQIEAKFRTVREASEMDSITPGGSRYFTPFLHSFARRAIAEGDPVSVATSGSEMIGMAMLDKESRLGSVFALDQAVAKVFVKRLRLKDFFVEVDGQTWSFPPAEQLDVFEILELKNPAPVPYDNTHVRPMTHDDIPAVTRIAQDVYKGPAKRWVTSCFEAGDVAYVAVSGTVVVGFGFATVVDQKARLHTLTMSPAYRASGLGTEIMAARLTVLSALGVDSVIVEISRHNDASMAVARKAGFNKIGETIYYSSKPPKLETVNQRRF